MTPSERQARRFLGRLVAHGYVSPVGATGATLTTAQAPRRARAIGVDRQPDSVTTVIGQVASPEGRRLQRDRWDRPVPSVLPAAAFRRTVRFPLPLLLAHGEQVGVCDYLERSETAGLLLVGRVVYSGILDGSEWYLSAGTTAKRGDATLHFQDARLDEVSLVRDPADSVRPVRWADHFDLARQPGGQPLGLPLVWEGVWGRAHRVMASRRYRRAPETFDIVDFDVFGEPVGTRASPEPREATRSRAPQPVARSAPERPPAPLRSRPAIDRRTAAQMAEQCGVDGFSFTGEFGEQVRVRTGGRIVRFT